MSFTGTNEYVASEQLQMAVNAAVELQRPLLIKGEPGTGKTMLAKAVAHESQAHFLAVNVADLIKSGVGDSEKAISDLFKKAAAVDPGDYQSRCLRGQILRGAGQLDEAFSQAREAVEVIEKHLKWYPDDARAYLLGAGSLVIQGDAVNNGVWENYRGLGEVCTALGDVERAKRWLHRAIEIAPNESIVLYNVACNLATLGETDKALDYLEQAAKQGTVSAAWMRNDEDLASLRGEARYSALLDRLDGK